MHGLERAPQHGAVRLPRPCACACTTPSPEPGILQHLVVFGKRRERLAELFSSFIRDRIQIVSMFLWHSRGNRLGYVTKATAFPASWRAGSRAAGRQHLSDPTVNINIFLGSARVGQPGNFGPGPGGHPSLVIVLRCSLFLFASFSYL